MIVIGCRMAHSDPRIVLKSAAVWISTIERPVVFPLLLLLLLALHLTGIRGVVAMVAMITTCAPAASVTTMMAVFCRHDEAAAANVVSLQTALSALTMPLLITLGQKLLM